MFKRRDASEGLIEEALELIDFMNEHGIKAPVLKENGLLVDDDTTPGLVSER